MLLPRATLDNRRLFLAEILLLLLLLLLPLPLLLLLLLLLWIGVGAYCKHKISKSACVYGVYIPCILLIIKERGHSLLLRRHVKQFVETRVYTSGKNKFLAKNFSGHPAEIRNHSEGVKGFNILDQLRQLGMMLRAQYYRSYKSTHKQKKCTPCCRKSIRCGGR